ncbi:Putative nucleoside-diphosphate-sugar epimerase [Photobacterium marinum]|uniref:Putative nucleoside-diphosphate-sugar epimerase n=1 Tax=Photobacterium marinum TaxID=1056511 RepID=L8J692_9GAMM|nr:NAD(P)H-binding protein [Photobacterium marinum]ELR63703.1 Putative nucleoside-diphosphate-sugar epimerase [Photobacterium marinum]
MSQGTANAIIAGASGLVGDELLHQLLGHPHFQTVYSLSRHELPFHSNKLVQIIHPELRITSWEDSDLTPTIGFICLGTTKKQAGSNKALESVDLHLVKEVATTMHLLGVKHIVVISSLFASRYSPSHYLRCKGKMERALKKIGFDHCVFVRPGPLKGERVKPRKDELLVQSIFKLLRPIAIGPLAHLNPIPAEDVARAMLELALLAEDNVLSKVTIISGKALFPDPLEHQTD